MYSRPRVAQHTIPRLELCAAALTIQVDATLTREISADMDIQSSVYWTDGMIVLAYLQVDSKHYHTFVGNRVARIRSHSEASQWRHVPSEQKPTDLASSVSHLASSEWFYGPKSLTQQESEWSSCEKLVPVLESDIEVKRNVIYSIICLKSVDVRSLQFAILAQSPREMSLTDRILPRYFLSRLTSSRLNSA